MNGPKRHFFKETKDELPMGTKVAFDVTYSDKTIGAYSRHGHHVVCVARPGETDESWVGRAMEAGAEIVFSEDSDVGNILERENWFFMKWRRIA